MALSIVGLFIIVMASLENIGADNNRNLTASDEQYLDVIVSFWKIISEKDEREFLCIGALIAPNWIFVTKKCRDILRESGRTVICTGSSYFDDIDINFITSSTIEFPKKSKFIVLIINVDIQTSSFFQIVCMHFTDNEKYSAVLVGWSKKYGQPLIEPFTFVTTQNQMYMDIRNRTELDVSEIYTLKNNWFVPTKFSWINYRICLLYDWPHFWSIQQKNFCYANKDVLFRYDSCPEGSLAVMGKKIIAVSRLEYDRIRFNKILSFEPLKVASELRQRSEGNTNLQCSSKIDNRRKIKINSQDYINTLVSLWKMISEKEYYILCLGALIKSNLIFITTQCSDKVFPLENVGILTGMNKQSDPPERILKSKQLLHENSEFTILVLNRDIELSSPIRIGVLTTSIHEIDINGVLLGWNKKKGRISMPLSFKNVEGLLLVSSVQNYSDEDFPLGGIAIKGRNIIGFTYSDKQNNVDENGMIRAITTTSERKIVLSKITYADFTKVHLLLRKGSNDNSVITKDDYFNFVVSLWAQKNPKENKPENFDLLCLGALIKSELILVNNYCLTEVNSFSLDNIGILTKSMFSNQLLPKTEVVIDHRPLRVGSKYSVLILGQDFHASSHIRVDCSTEDDTEKENGMLVGWNIQGGPVIKSIQFRYANHIYIPKTSFGDANDIANFPLGSLVIFRKNFKASIYIERQEGTKRSEGVKFIWTNKFTERDSLRAKMFLHDKKRYTKNKKRMCEMFSFSKRIRSEEKFE